MEKRAQKGHYCREREASPEMKQSDLMGGGFDADKARIMKQEVFSPLSSREQPDNAHQQCLSLTVAVAVRRLLDAMNTML